MVQASVPAGLGELGSKLSDLAERLAGVSDQVREISHGIHPADRSSADLRSALRALARRSVVPVDMDVRIEGHLPEPVEVGAYYVVSEMLTNAAKHARASVVAVDVETSAAPSGYACATTDSSSATRSGAQDLPAATDRIEALGGIFSLHSPQGGGTAGAANFRFPATAAGCVPRPVARAGPACTGGRARRRRCPAARRRRQPAWAAGRS